VKSAFVLLALVAIAQHESGTRKAISWSVTLYNKNLSSQCNLTAQVEQAQDKKKFVVKVMSSFFINQILPQ
jgi:hypothetical protein